MLKNTRASFPNLNYRELRKVCAAKPQQLAGKYGLKETITPFGRSWFKDNGANILAVAHTDSVQPFTHFTINRMKPDTWIFCPTLDDRLGAYLILDWLPTAGVHIDILLTEGEEKGQSTALQFVPPKGKKYNWIFMFDRMGNVSSYTDPDVALYNYQDAITRAAVMKHGMNPVRGTYSCISDLEFLECKGFNFNAGYHNHHSIYAFASKREIINSLRNFMSFYRDYKDTEFTHEFRTTFSHESKGTSYYQESFDYYGDQKKSKVEKLHEFRDKKKKERAAQSTVAEPPSKTAISAVLRQDVSILNIPTPISFKLFDAHFVNIADLVRHKKHDIGMKFLDKHLTSSFTPQDFEVIEEALGRLGLRFDFPIAEYGVSEKDIMDKIFEDKSTRTAPIVPRPLIPKTAPSVKKATIIQLNPKDRQGGINRARVLRENGHAVAAQDQCVRCHEWFDVSADGKLDELVCPSCKQEEIELERAKLPQRKGIFAPIPLKKDSDDHARYVNTKDGPRWVEITELRPEGKPNEKHKIGFDPLPAA